MASSMWDKGVEAHIATLFELKCTTFRLHKVALTPEAKKELLARALGNTGTGGGGAFVIDAMAFQMG